MPDHPPPAATGANAAPDPLAVTRALLRHLGELSRVRARRGPAGEIPGTPTPSTPAAPRTSGAHPTGRPGPPGD
ncbi:hypothetical protein DZF91_22975, partial [Actinomadura logoneensis]